MVQVTAKGGECDGSNALGLGSNFSKRIQDTLEATDDKIMKLHDALKLHRTAELPHNVLASVVLLSAPCQHGLRSDSLKNSWKGKVLILPRVIAETLAKPSSVAHIRRQRRHGWRGSHAGPDVLRLEEFLKTLR